MENNNNNDQNPNAYAALIILFIFGISFCYNSYIHFIIKIF